MMKTLDMKDYIEYEISNKEVMQVVTRKDGQFLIRLYDSKRKNKLSQRLALTPEAFDNVLKGFEVGFSWSSVLKDFTIPYEVRDYA